MDGKAKAKAKDLVQTKLSFGKRNIPTSDLKRQKKQRLDGLGDDNPDKNGLELKSPSQNDREDDGVDKEKSKLAIDSSNQSTPSTSGSSRPKIPVPQATTATEPPPTTAIATAPAPLSQLIHLTDKSGDIFSAPPNTLLIQACNAGGAWGAGIAKAFKQHYPDAYQIYRGHCQRSVPEHLVGTALLIAPRAGAKKQHYIGCLFTSKGHGRTRDKPEKILAVTGPAMRDLLRQVAMEEGIGEMRMCRINSGLFAVPWEDSKKAIEGLVLGKEEIPEDDWPWRIVVYVPA